MATTGLASSAASKFDANTPTKASLLSPEIAGQLLVNLDDRIQALRSEKDNGLDLEGLLAFQHVANYLYVSISFLAMV
jgi:xylulose-5-phosphate/fructose-6-phosphate phosphoketolase